jgi:hypothetical protein
VDELVARLNDKQKRTGLKKEEKEPSHNPKPSISIKSKSLAAGMESLEDRVSKIMLRKEEKLEIARGKKELEEIAALEYFGKPTITSKASKIQRDFLGSQEKWLSGKEQKIAQRQHLRMEEGLRECTFRPNISSGSKTLIKEIRQSEVGMDTELGSHAMRHDFDEDVNRVYDRLNADAHRRRTTREAVMISTDAESNMTSVAQSGASKKVVTPRQKHRDVRGSSTTGDASLSQSSGSKAPRHAVGSVPDPSETKALSFENFMQSLAAENPDLHLDRHFHTPSDPTASFSLPAACLGALEPDD